ncbi:MAG TPA: MATE family efflux transporter [Flavisolibacter sp.]|nr:MATE family efflux transporter [Flavisolibacter sp.]
MDKKILRWNFVFQYGWVLTNIFNSLLLLPLYLKNIDKDSLGIWLATGNILGWMTMVDPGVGEVLQQKIAELRGQKKHYEIGKTIGSGFLASGIILLLAFGLGLVCYSFAGRLIDKDISAYGNLPMALVISVVATGLSLVSFSLSGINQGLHNSAQVAICSITANFLFLFVNLVLLYQGFGVMSIALANLCRALYINIHNLISLFKVLREQYLRPVFEWLHFKKFIRIFSFTSASKIITGLSYSVDMIVLARYIPPAMIAIFEINKRPVNVAYSLIGRHSVALMPLISHAKGSGDKGSILQLLTRQLRIYGYATVFVSLLFCFNYDYLISAWTGKENFIGHLVAYLLVAGFFLSLFSYFMAIVGYALGDIKMNSVYNILRNIFFGVLMYFAARNYGIVGTLVVSIAITLLADLFFYTYRLHRLGYMDGALLKSAFRYWPLLLPLSVLAGWGLKALFASLVPEGLYFNKLLLNTGFFSFFFLALVLLIDPSWRQGAKSLATRYVITPIYKYIRA